MKWSAIPATVLALALAGCGSAQDEAEYRAANVAECVKGTNATTAEAQAQAEELCGCAIDKVIEKYGTVGSIDGSQIDEVLGECVPQGDISPAG